MYWLFCVCRIQYYILYFVLLQPSLFTFHSFLQLALLKYFPLFARHNIVSASSCLLEWIFSVSFIPQLVLKAWTLPCHLSYVHYVHCLFLNSWNGADSFFFVSIPSTPQQLFSLSLTSSFHLLCICLFLILYQPDMVGQAAPLDETQENLYSLAINAKYSNDGRQLGPVAQIRFSEKVWLLNSKCTLFFSMSAFIFTLQVAIQYNINLISLLQNS